LIPLCTYVSTFFFAGLPVACLASKKCCVFMVCDAGFNRQPVLPLARVVLPYSVTPSFLQFLRCFFPVPLSYRVHSVLLSPPLFFLLRASLPFRQPRHGHANVSTWPTCLQCTVALGRVFPREKRPTVPCTFHEFLGGNGPRGNDPVFIRPLSEPGRYLKV